MFCIYTMGISFVPQGSLRMPLNHRVLILSRLMTMAKHLHSSQGESDPDCALLNLHLLKSVIVYNAIELWNVLTDFENHPASLCGVDMIIIDGFSCILASSM